MVATVGSIQVLFNAQYAEAVTSLRRFASESDKTAGKITKSVAQIDKAAVAANRSMSRIDGSQFRTLTLSALRAQNSVERLKGALLSISALGGGFAAAFALKGIQEYSDTYRQLNNQIRVSIGASGDLKKTQEDIFNVAQESRAEYEATAKLFSRINNSAKRLGITQKQSLGVVSTIQKAFTLGGSTPTEAAQSSLQLSQGIASNKLGGDELRSVLENPALGQLLADKISNGDLGKLRELSEEGKLTAGVVIRAFRDAGKEIDALFKNTEETVAGSFQKIDNAILRYVGTNETIQSGTSATIVMLNSLAEGMNGVAAAVQFLGLAAAGVFGGKRLSELGAYIGGVARLRKENLANAEAAMKAANAVVAGRKLSNLEKATLPLSERFAAQGTADRLKAAQLAVANAGGAVDTEATAKARAQANETAKRITALRQEAEAVKNLAAAERVEARQAAYDAAKKASMVRKTLADGGLIADPQQLRTISKEERAASARLIDTKLQREEALKAAKAIRDQAAATAEDTRAKYDNIRAGVLNKGNIADSTTIRKELDTTGSIGDRAIARQLEAKALESVAKAQLDVANATAKAAQARATALGGARTPEGVAAPASQSVLANARKEAADATELAAKAEEKYQAAIQARVGAERDAVTVTNNNVSRMEALGKQIGVNASKDLSEAYQANAKASLAAAAAEEDYRTSLKAVEQAERDLVTVRNNAVDERTRQFKTDGRSQLGDAYRDQISASQAAIEAQAKYDNAVKASMELERQAAAAQAASDQALKEARSTVVVAAQKELAEATKANAIATRNASIATAQYNGVLKSQALAARASALAMRGLSAVTNFFGGPIGLGLVALSGILAYNSYQSAKAQETLDRYSDALKTAEAQAAKTSVALQRVGGAQEKIIAGKSGGAAERLAALKTETTELENLFAQMGGKLDEIGGKANQAGGRMLVFKSVKKDAEALVLQFQRGELAFEDFKSALDNLAGANPDMSPFLTALVNIARMAEIARGAIASLKGEFPSMGFQPKGARPGSTTDLKNQNPEAIKALADRMTEERLKKLEDTPSNKIDDFTARFYGIDGAKATKEGGSKKEDPYATATASAKEHIAELEAEAQALQQVNPLVNDYGKKVAAAKAAQDLLTAAQKGGHAVGKELTDVNQLLYGDLTKLTPAARAEAEAIRQIALASGDASAKVALLNEQNQKAAELLEFEKDVMKGALSTFRQSLIEGKSLWQALGDVALNVLDKIADKLETMIVDSLFQTGAGTGINSLFSFLFGGAKVATGGASGAGGIGLASGTKMARGGPTLVGEKGPEVVNMQRGAKVTPHYLAQQELDRLASEQAGFGGSATAGALSEGGNHRGQGAVKVTVETYTRKDGNWESRVAEISYGTSAPMIAAAGEQMEATELPGTVNSITRRPRRRKVK